MKFIIGIDPGEQKCGVGILQTDIGNAEATLIAGLRPTAQQLGELIEKWVSEVGIDDLFVCYEQYRVYAAKLKSHRFSRVQTVESIGMLEYLIKKYNIPFQKYMAGLHKGVVTKERIKKIGMWGAYNSIDGPHIRDGIGVAIFAWKFKGVFNNGKRVITEADKIILEL